MIGKDKLIYVSATPSDGDSVAAFVHGSAGKITSTTVGSAHGLDVNVLNELTCDLDGVYNVTTNPTPDHAGIIVNTRATTPDDTTQTKRITGAAASADGVTPADTHGMDVNAFLMGYNATDTAWDRLVVDNTTTGLLVHLVGNDVSFECVGNVADDDADSGNPVKTGTRALGAALTAVSANNDRADMVSDLYRRVYVNDSPNIALNGNTVSIPDSAATLIATASAGRRRILVQNLGNKALYVGGSAVTTANGIRVASGAYIELPLGQYIDLYGRSESGSLDVRFLQLA